MHQCEYKDTGFNLKKLMKKATIISSKEALKDKEPFDWPTEVADGTKKVLVNEKGIHIE